MSLTMRKFTSRIGLVGGSSDVRTGSPIETRLPGQSYLLAHCKLTCPCLGG